MRNKDTYVVKSTNPNGTFDIVHKTSKSSTMYRVTANNSEIAKGRVINGLMRYCEFIGKIYHTN